MSGFKIDMAKTASMAYWKSFSPASFRTQIQRDMFKAVAMMHKDLAEIGFGGKVRRSGMFMSSEPGNQVATRESAGARSRLSMDVFVKGTEVVAVVGSPDKYILANERGATITPTSSKMLAIPTVNILTPAGRLKNEWAAKLAGGGWRGIWKQEGLFVLRTSKGGTGGAWIARKVGGTSHAKGTGRFKGGAAKGQRIELLAYLTSKVTLVPRWMFRTSAKRVAPEVGRIIGAGVFTMMVNAQGAK